MMNDFDYRMTICLILTWLFFAILGLVVAAGCIQLR